MARFRYLVEDVPAATDFYLSNLGFEVDKQFGDVISILRRGDLELIVAGPKTSGARDMPDGTKPGPGGWNRFLLETDDLEAWVSELKSNGVPFRNEIVEGPGGKQILCVDPSGNAVELFQST